MEDKTARALVKEIHELRQHISDLVVATESCAFQLERHFFLHAKKSGGFSPDEINPPPWIRS